MASPPGDDKELMAFMDGELPARDARAVEARLDQDPVAKQQLAALSQLASVVREHYEDAGQTLEPRVAGLWAKIEGQLEPPPRPAAAPEASGGLWAWLVETFTPRTIGVGLVGVAAGVLIMLAAGGGAKRSITVSWDLRLPEAPAPTDVRTAQATQIEELEVQSGSAMVFQVPSEDANEPATTVVWVTGESAAEEPI